MKYIRELSKIMYDSDKCGNRALCIYAYCAIRYAVAIYFHFLTLCRSRTQLHNLNKIWEQVNMIEMSKSQIIIWFIWYCTQCWLNNRSRASKYFCLENILLISENMFISDAAFAVTKREQKKE